jgi:hypothetical protein
MNDFIAADVAIGGLALAVAVLHASWQEFAAKKRRDAKLLAAVGAVSLLGSAAAWLRN